MSRRSCRLRSAGILDKLVTFVRCPCKVDKYEGLMILCDECGFWQHGPCFTIIGEQYVPAKHCCNACADSPSKCTDPRICLPNSNLVQASCLYRRTLVLLNSHKGRMTPARIARLLDVDIAIGSSIIDKLLSEKILKFGKAKLSCIIDRKNLLNYAFPKYLNKVVQQVPINTDVNITARFGKNNVVSNDTSIVEDVVEANTDSPPGGYENHKENKSDGMKNEVVKIEFKSSLPIKKFTENCKNKLSERKVFDVDQITPVKEINSLSYIGKDGIKTRDISADAKVARLFEESLHCNSVTIADAIADNEDDIKKTFLYNHSSVKEKRNDENELNSFEIIERDQSSAKKLKRLNRKRSKLNAFQENTNEKLMTKRVEHHAKMECIFCKQIFSRKSNLTVHINKIHSLGYQCSQCDFAIKDKNKFFMHVSSHSENILEEKKIKRGKEIARIECSFCNKIFSRRNNLTVHIAAFHSQEFQCSQCEFSIMDKKKYLKHVSSHAQYILQGKTNEKLPSERVEHLANIECPLCNRIFSQKSHLGVHIDQVHSQVYQCSQCEFSVNDRNKYLLHITSHQNNILQEKKIKKLLSEKFKNCVIFECSFCNDIFRKKSNLTVHVDKIHSQVYQCSQCEFSFNDKNKYLKHVSSHISLKCSQCHKTFGNKYKLTVHVSCVHEKLKNFKCVLCDFVSFTQDNLRRHVRTVHQKLKPFKCTLCISSFSKRDHLNNHIIAVHQKEKRYKCLYCDFSASFYKSLSAHILTMHAGEDKLRPFKCTICSKSYDMKWQLNTHMSFHDKTKFKCKDCSFVTGYRKNLIRHLRVVHKIDLRMHVSGVHDEEKLFQCDECGFTARYKWNLKCHIRAVHLKWRPFQCDECNYMFSEKRSLDYHIRAIHLKRLKCSQCEFTCNGERELFVHTNAVHEKIDPFQCDDCGFVSNYKWNVVCHMRSAHKQ